MVKPCSLLIEESSLFWITIIERKDTKIKVMKPLEETLSRTDMHAIWVKQAGWGFPMNALYIQVAFFECFLQGKIQQAIFSSSHIHMRSPQQETPLPIFDLFFTPYAFPYTTPKEFVSPGVNLLFIKWLCKPLHQKHRQENSAVEATHYSPFPSDLYMVSKMQKYFLLTTQVI